MDLTPRLLKIAQEIRPKERVGDIGTDHGYLPIYLIKNQIASTVIATDINPEPLCAARNNIRAHGLDEHIKTKLGAGTVPLEEEELDVIIVAGMGGKLIIEILKNSSRLKKSVNRMILQPMQQQSELRLHLSMEGYHIEKDLLVQEGRRIYEILVVSLKTGGKSKEPEERSPSIPGPETARIEKQYPKSFEIYQSMQMELGFFFFENPKSLAEKFLDLRIDQMEKIIRETGGRDSEAAIRMNERAKIKADKLKEVKGCL